MIKTQYEFSDILKVYDNTLIHDTSYISIYIHIHTYTTYFYIILKNSSTNMAVWDS